MFTNGGYYKNKITLKWRFAFLGDSSLSKKLSLTSLILSLKVTLAVCGRNERQGNAHFKGVPEEGWVRPVLPRLNLQAEAMGGGAGKSKGQ